MGVIVRYLWFVGCFYVGWRGLGLYEMRSSSSQMSLSIQIW